MNPKKSPIWVIFIIYDIVVKKCSFPEYQRARVTTNVTDSKQSFNKQEVNIEQVTL